MKKTRQILRAYQKLTFKSWWVILFALCCYMVYERGAFKKDIELNLLKAKLVEMETHKQTLLDEQGDLITQIQSQNDPDWIELTLMKGLGLVPEGQTKVLFQKKIDSN
ncbi:MAG: hypothetical protein JHC93_05130 [Parachlamydiales bacterium]|nr:hypothetical protein [Parachlamydiales bacterium]